jgi:hypothetical protein
MTINDVPQPPSEADVAVDLWACYDDWLSGEPLVNEVGDRLVAAVVAIGAAYRRALYAEARVRELEGLLKESLKYLPARERCGPEAKKFVQAVHRLAAGEIQ